MRMYVVDVLSFRLRKWSIRAGTLYPFEPLVLIQSRFDGQMFGCISQRRTRAANARISRAVACGFSIIGEWPAPGTGATCALGMLS